MIIKNAIWEQRNLGVTSAEVEIEPSDTLASVKQQLLELEQQYQYIAVKVPSSLHEQTWLMNDIVRTPLQQRLYDAVTISEITEEDFKLLHEEIEKGSFSFDRISNDPVFGQKLGTKRFHNWLNDEKERGAIFLKGEIKGEMTGFFTIREIEPGVYTSALGGTFMKWRKGGLGTNVQTPAEVKKRGGKKLILGVSTNNMIQIRALIQNGFFPKSANHVFVKHIKCKPQ